MIGEIGLDKSGGLIVVVPASELSDFFPEPIEPDVAGIGKLIPSPPFHLARKLLRKTLRLFPLSDLLAFPDGFGFMSELLDIPEELEECAPGTIHIRLKKLPHKRVKSLFDHVSESVIPSTSSCIRIMGKQVKRYKYLKINDRVVNFMETELDGLPIYILLGDSEEPVCYIGEGVKDDQPVQFLIVRFKDFDACKNFFDRYLGVTIQYAKRYDLDDLVENLKAIISG